MKTLSLALIALFVTPLLISTLAEASGIQEGAIVYDSLTHIGHSYVYLNPGVTIAGRRAYIYTEAATNFDYYGRGFCRAAGFSTGRVGDVIQVDGNDQAPNLFARFESNGELVAVTQNWTSAAANITCQE